MPTPYMPTPGMPTSRHSGSGHRGHFSMKKSRYAHHLHAHQKITETYYFLVTPIANWLVSSQARCCSASQRDI